MIGNITVDSYECTCNMVNQMVQGVLAYSWTYFLYYFISGRMCDLPYIYNPVRGLSMWAEIIRWPLFSVNFTYMMPTMFRFLYMPVWTNKSLFNIDNFHGSFISFTILVLTSSYLIITAPQNFIKLSGQFEITVVPLDRLIFI